MARRATLIVIVVIAVFAFLFLVPVVNTGNYPNFGCPANGECRAYPDYASISYRIFSIGGVWMGGGYIGGAFVPEHFVVLF
jgi:hypothetical protein